MKKSLLKIMFAAFAAVALAAVSQAAGARAVGTSHVQWDRLTEDDVVVGELVVGYRDGSVATRRGARSGRSWEAPARMADVRAAAGVALKRSFARVPAEVVALPEGADIEEMRIAAEKIAADRAVAFVEPNYRVHAFAVPGDPAYPDKLWGLGAIGAEEAWDLTTGSSDVVVAVIDSGVRVTHEDLAANIWTNPGEIPDNGIDDDGNGFIDDVHGWDFVENDNEPQDEHGHGTHVSGTIGAVGDNGTGLVGVNWNVSIVPVRGLNAKGQGDTVQLVGAIEYVSWFDGKDGRPRIHLSNNSWGGYYGAEVERLAIEKCLASDQLFIAAAGNDTNDNDANPSYPASFDLDNIISVASVADSDTGDYQLSWFSNYGATSVDLAAPGGDSEGGAGEIYSCGIVSDSSYDIMSGTSMACPHVAGAAALLYSVAPAADFATIRDALLDSAAENKFDALEGKCVTGGLLNLPKALAKVGGLIVSPADLQKFAGEPGGPFAPDAVTYTLANVSTNDMTVSAAILDPSWLAMEPDLSLSPVTIPAGGSIEVVVSIGAGAASLPEARYDNLVTFSYPDPEAGAPEEGGEGEDGEGGDPSPVGTIDVERAISLKVSYNYAMQSEPDYEWLGGVGESRALSGDDLGTPIELPVPVTFYNATYDSMVVSANGAISFGSTEVPAANASLPCDGIEDALVCPYWDALEYVDGVSSVTVEFSESGAVIVSWIDMALSLEEGSKVSFQAVLIPDAEGGNCSVLFNVREAAVDFASGAARFATVGLQDDGAFFSSLYSVNGEHPDLGTLWLADEQSILFTWKDAVPDSEAPYVESIKSVKMVPGVDGTEGYAELEVRFSEIVLGLEAGDFDFSSSTVAGEPYVAGIEGGGERFIVKVAGFFDYGRLIVSLADGAVVDLAGNENAASDEFAFSMPYMVTHFFDDFEKGKGHWTTSTNAYSAATSDIWELGTPSAWTVDNYLDSVFWPQSAFSGSQCWGTVMDGAYPRWVNAWLQAPRVFVGEDVTISFQVATDLGFGIVDGYADGGDYAVVEVSRDGDSWKIIGAIDSADAVVPSKSNGEWNRYAIDLPEEFENSAIDIRIRFVSDNFDYSATAQLPDGAGVYVDDFRVFSLKSEGVWLVGSDPEVLVPGTETNVETYVYNAGLESAVDVSGYYGIADGGVQMVSDNPEYFGDIPSGGIVTGVVLRVSVGDATSFANDTVPLSFDAYVSGERDNTSSIDLGIEGVDLSGRTLTFTAQSLSGVSDWMDTLLAGNGDDDSPIVQIIWAGADGKIDPATDSGATTGDDMLLYTAIGGNSFIRIGAVGMQPDLGQFSDDILHGLAAGSLVYARAWSGATFDASVAYGDSEAKPITAVDGEIVDFGSWKLDTPVHYMRDSNGDTIPDGWCVLEGLDPFAPVESLFESGSGSLTVTASVTGKNKDAATDNDIFAPRRAVSSGDFVYIPSRKTATVGGSIAIYDLDLTERVSTVSKILAADGKEYDFDPTALAVDEDDGILAVAASSGQAWRILFFEIDETSGELTYVQALPEYGTKGLPTEDGRFKDIRDIAYSSDLGQFLVIDSQLIDKAYYRVQSIEADLVTVSVAASLEYGLAGFTQAPSAIAIDGEGTMYVANPGVSSIELYEQSGDTWDYADSFVFADAALQWPAGISCGAGGFIYVMERDAHRIRLVNSDGETLMLYPFIEGNTGSFGSELGEFHSPEGVFVPSVSDGVHTILVADTGNDRVQWVDLVVDGDGDGMDDLWELENGLDPTIDDSMLDPDGDGLVNIGEYRGGTDPVSPDTNGNGGSDLWDMQNEIDPVEESAEVNPVTFVSVAASPEGADFGPGSNVLVTVTFSGEIAETAKVMIELSDGAVTHPTAMTRVDATTYTFEYLVGDDDEGLVDATITGAVDVDGYTTDPAEYIAEDLFMVLCPPSVVSVAADPLLAEAGSNVVVTVTFDQDIDAASAVEVELYGGATATIELAPVDGDPSTYTGAYVVVNGDLGDVCGKVSGAVGSTGKEMDGEYDAGKLFEVVSSITPPEVVSVVADPVSTVAGSNVVITVTFDQDIATDADVEIELLGGASGIVKLVPSDSDPSTYIGTYTVDGADFGAVSGVVSGAVGLTGKPMDGDYDAGEIFEVTFPDFSITAFGVDPFFIEWEADENGVYAIKSSLTIVGGGSFDTVVVEKFVAPSTGIVGYTNAEYEVKSGEFFKVYRLEPVAE